MHGGEPRLLAGDDDHREPALLLGQLGVEREVVGDLEDARGALGALEVPAEPEAMISDARDHAGSFWTQVSFEPPPWLELTTYDPSRSATRLSPPGSTHGPSGLERT